MRNFSSLLVRLDRAVERKLCDDALYFGDDDPDAAEGLRVRVMIDHTRSADRLSGGMSFTRSRPVLRVARDILPHLAEGHLFRVDDDVWALAEAPVAEDDGRWWAAEVEPG